ncbi:MAG: glycosyltransferase family 4 protein [Elusimicrobia bacterium]|nr:glycosyltransferase family 4 protein [Elusimicrobiota bacterium]
MPSVREGFPFLLLEAMASEKPVVATAIDGIKEAVLPGETALLVPPRDPDALAAGILKVLEDPEFSRQLGKRGRQHLEKNFSLDRMLRETQMVYEDVLQG